MRTKATFPSFEQAPTPPSSPLPVPFSSFRFPQARKQRRTKPISSSWTNVRYDGWAAGNRKQDLQVRLGIYAGVSLALPFPPPSAHPVRKRGRPRIELAQSSSNANIRPEMEEKYIIPNLRNACRVLKWLGDHPDGATIPDLARNLKLPRTTALRIVRTLAAENLLRQQDTSYQLGARLISLGLSARSGVGLRPIVAPFLKKLTETTGETSHVAIPCEGRPLILEVCDSLHPIRAASRAGTIADPHCSSTGKILLAFLYESRLEELFPNGEIPRRTPKTLITFDAIRADLKRVRERGYSIEDEEYHAGVRGLAAPIRDATGQVVAAVGITASIIRFTPEDEEKIAREVRAAGDMISRELGNRNAATS